MLRALDVEREEKKRKEKRRNKKLVTRTDGLHYLLLARPII